MKTRTSWSQALKSQAVCGIILLLMGIQSGFSQSSKVVQPAIGVSPLWIAGEYGLYWGLTLTGELVFMKRHKVSLSADLAPLGLLDMTDVDTEGKEQHWGGTLSYLFQIGIANNLMRIEPGATIGLSSIPYIYGTFPSPIIDTTNSIDEERPERETILGFGPELRISIGRKSIQFFISGRSLFAKNHNFALLTNAGVALKL